MNLIVIENFSEAVDPIARKKRLVGVRRAMHRYQHKGNRAKDQRLAKHIDHDTSMSSYYATRNATGTGKYYHKAHKALEILKKHGYPKDSFISINHRSIPNMRNSYTSHEKRVVPGWGGKANPGRLSASYASQAANYRKQMTTKDRKSGKLRLKAGSKKTHIKDTPANYDTRRATLKGAYAASLDSLKDYTKRFKLP